MEEVLAPGAQSKKHTCTCTPTIFLTWKIVLFDIFTQVPGQTTILAGFAAFFYADLCRRYVESSFLSLFHDHFCFP